MSDQHTYNFFSHVHEAWDAIYEACAEARVSIAFEHYIFIDDESGRPLINLFKQKVKEGVRVRVLLDALGSTTVFPFPLEAELKEAGVEITFFNTLVPWSFHYLNFWFFRDHRKIVVVDSKVAFTGGVCFQEHMRGWRDTCVRIQGPVVPQIERSFAVMWQRARKVRGVRQHRWRLDVDTPFIFLTNEPLLRRRFLYYELLERVKSAKYSISLTTPYFAPDHKLLQALCRASQRGVDISLLVPRRSDRYSVDLSAKSYFTKLLREGIKVYLGGEPFNHTKAGTIDGQWGTLGSLNLDSASLRYNFEGNLVINDPNFVLSLDQQFACDLQGAELLDASTWDQRPFHQKLLELLIQPIRFLF